MRFRPQNDNMAELAEFQRRHRVSLLCMVCVEVQGSAQLRSQVGDAETVRLLRQHDQVLRDLLASFPGGLEVGGGNEAFFLVFEKPSDAVRFALQLHRRVALLAKKTGHLVRDRVGIHVGEVLVEIPEGTTKLQGLNGAQVDVSQAVLSLAQPGQTLLTRFAFENARQSFKAGSRHGGDDLRWASHGLYQVRDFDEAIEVCEVAEASRPTLSPPAGNDRIRRLATEGDRSDSWPAERTETRLLGRVRQATQDESRAARTGAALAAFAGLVALLGGWLDGLSYDLAFLFRRTQTPNEVVIVQMDDDSYLRLNQSSAEKWDRRLHAQLIDHLREAGARAIGFDILFDNETTSEADQQLREALARFRSVGLAAKFAVENHDGIESRRVIRPAASFLDLVPWGLAEQSPGRDAIRQPVGQMLPEHPSLASVLAGWGDRQVPRSTAGSWLNYYGPPGSLARRSYVSVLSNDVPAEAFSNRVVYVGATTDLSPASGRVSDFFPSPYSRWGAPAISGVEINATSYVNLIRSDWLHRLPPALEATLVLVLGAGLGYLFVFFSPARAVGLGLAASPILAAASAAQVWSTHVWFPWLVVCGAQIPTAAGWAVIARTRLLVAEDRQLRKILARRRVAPAAQPESASAAPSGDGTRLMSAEDHARALAATPSIPDHVMLRRIGKGAYGEVWLARDVIGGFHAVKIVRRAEFADEGPFEREFRGLEKYNRISRAHPNLVHILHVGRNDVAGFLYYVMEVSDDVTRQQQIDPEVYQPRDLRADITRLGRLPLREVVDCGLALADALAFVHRRQLVHRDLKPANIIYVHGIPKLADVGLVTDVAQPGHDITMVGTQGFMPPEGHGSPSADVYSLGKLLYVAVTGCPVRDFPDAPPELTESPEADLMFEFFDLLLRACEPIQSHRYQSADEFHAGLSRFARRHFIENPPASHPPAPRDA